MELLLLPAPPGMDIQGLQLVLTDKLMIESLYIAGEEGVELLLLPPPPGMDMPDQLMIESLYLAGEGLEAWSSFYCRLHQVWA